MKHKQSKNYTGPDMNKDYEVYLKLNPKDKKVSKEVFHQIWMDCIKKMIIEEIVELGKKSDACQ